jgi:hypothetical protein
MGINKNFPMVFFPVNKSTLQIGKKKDRKQERNKASKKARRKKASKQERKIEGIL